MCCVPYGQFPFPSCTNLSSRYDLLLDEEEEKEGGSHQAFDRKLKEKKHHSHHSDDEDARKPKKSKVRKEILSLHVCCVCWLAPC